MATKESFLLREAESFWPCAVVVVMSQNKMVIQKGETNYCIRGTGLLDEKTKFMLNFYVQFLEFGELF